MFLLEERPILRIVLLLTIFFINILECTLFAKVDPRFPSDFSSCFLSSHSNVKNNIFCGFLCVQQPGCILFCFEGAECRLYKAHVSRHWAGIQNDPYPQTRCFTSWGSAKDAIPTSTFTATPRYTAWDGSIKMAVNGYSCAKDAGFSYCSSQVIRPWWAADLGTVRRITSVRILTRAETRYSSKFKNVEVRVGMSKPGNGDFSANTLLGIYTNEAPQKTAIYFQTDVPIEGSVVSLQNVESTAQIIIIADVQILYE